MTTSTQQKIKLNQPHTHAGVKHPAGTVITVDAADANWLAAAQVGTPVENPIASDPEPKAGSSIPRATTGAKK